MDQLIAPQVQEPRRDEARRGVSTLAHQFTGSGDAFEIAHTGMWEFIGPSHRLAMRLTVKPPVGGVRTWEVPEVHPEGEWLAEFTEIRCIVGGNGTVDVGPKGRVELDATGHINGMTTKGAIVLRHGREPKLGRYKNFRALHSYDTGHPFWTLAGTGLRTTPMGGAVPELDCGWMVGFRRELVDSGVVPVMARSGANGSLDFHTSILENRIQNWGRIFDAGKMDSETFTRLVKDNRALQKAMTTAFERQFGDAGPLVAPGGDTGHGVDPLGLRDDQPPADLPQPPARRRSN
jgi:hypothetical protein